MARVFLFLLLMAVNAAAIERQSASPPLSLVRRVYVEALGEGKDQAA